MRYLLGFLTAGALLMPVLAGPYPPAAGQAGSDAIAAGDPRFTIWASSAVVERGPIEIGYPDSFLASFGDDSNATGPADATPSSPYSVVSLGDGGIATLEFTVPFSDVPGPDLAVFENGFMGTFLELAHVEVSSDGVNYFRFPSSSLTPATDDIGEGGSVDPSNVRNLAGKYLAGYGTPFDLAELKNVSPLLDIQRVTHVRVIDAVGTNDPAFATRDAAGNVIIDPYPTPYYSSGFDLDAVGAFSQTATTFGAWKIAQGIAAENPDADSDADGVPDLIEYLTGSGRLVLNGAAISFTRLSYRPDGNLRVEGSADLVHWSPLAQSVQGATMASMSPGVDVSESGDYAKQVTVNLPPASSLRFFRLAAEP